MINKKGQSVKELNLVQFRTYTLDKCGLLAGYFHIFPNIGCTSPFSVKFSDFIDFSHKTG